MTTSINQYNVLKISLSATFTNIDAIVLEFPTPLFHDRFSASYHNMQELPCHFITGLSSTYNNEKCVLIEGDSTRNIPVKVWITGFSSLSSPLEFYLAGIINPSTTDRWVSLGVKLYDGN